MLIVCNLKLRQIARQRRLVTPKIINSDYLRENLLAYCCSVSCTRNIEWDIDFTIRGHNDKYFVVDGIARVDRGGVHWVSGRRLRVASTLRGESML